MKNLLNISEEEKSRILEMHETATNKQYLSEQMAPQSLTDIDKKTLQTFLNKINTNTNPPTHWILDRNAGPTGQQRGDEVKLTGKENGMIFPTDFVGKPLTWSLVINGKKQAGHIYFTIIKNKYGLLYSFGSLIHGSVTMEPLAPNLNKAISQFNGEVSWQK
jgi:hypothetical protein